jgi:hypothetical protein
VGDRQPRQPAVMVVNADPANSYQVSTSSLGITSPSETMYTYDAASPSIVSSGFSGGTVPVSAESIVVLTNASGGPPTPTPTTPAPAPTTPTPAPTTPTATPTPTATSSPGPAGGTATFGLLGSGTAPTALTGLQCSAH